jgi:3-phosphoshikimate 1-carboxyvinyltransferase
MRLAPVDHFRGRFTLPGDKSISHRLALLGSLAHGETRIDNFSTGADCASTLACLDALGVSIARDGARVTVVGRGPEGLRPAPGPLDAGNSGSTLRMLAGILAGRPFDTVLTGDPSLRRRPVERVAAPLRAMGAGASSTDGRPPLTIRGGSLQPINWELSVASAQVKTAILLAGLQASGRTTVREPELSRDHTERLLPAFGVPVERDGLSVSVDGPARLTPFTMTVPGDASSAAFLVVAALILPRSEIRIDGVLLNPTRSAFLDVLRRMNASIEVSVVESEPEPVGFILARSSELVGVDVPPDAVPAVIDEIPALAIAAAHARGRTSVTGAAELRLKESDRIAALVEGLRRMGGRAEERPDGLVVEGGSRLTGATVRSQDDHRIAMAFSVAALAARGETEIEGAECASVSFPQFYDCLRRAAG